VYGIATKCSPAELGVDEEKENNRDDEPYEKGCDCDDVIDPIRLAVSEGAPYLGYQRHERKEKRRYEKPGSVPCAASRKAHADNRNCSDNQRRQATPKTTKEGGNPRADLVDEQESDRSYDHLAQGS